MIPNQQRRRLRRNSTGQKIYLPEETIEQILLKLPTKSLVRFKSVCKLWLSLISQPTFKNLQLKYILSNQHDHQIMIVSASNNPQIFLLNLQDGKAVEKKYNIPPFPDLNHLSLLGSCNGLLLVKIRTLNRTFNGRISYYDDIILWNPLFNDYQKIPLDNPSDSSFSGFCYDNYIQDYKLVNISKTFFVLKGEIYYLKSGSKRRLHFEFDHQDFGSSLSFNCHYGRVFKGCFYWIIQVKDEKEPVLLELNIRYEKFRLIHLPTNFKVVSTCVRLDVANRDCLGIFLFDYTRIYFKLVTMKKEEDGSGISWNMVKIQNPEDRVGWPICMVSNDAILMKLANKLPNTPKIPTNYDLIIYNPLKKTITNTVIHEAGNIPYYISYMESLVLPESAE